MKLNPQQLDKKALGSIKDARWFQHKGFNLEHADIVDRFDTSEGSICVIDIHFSDHSNEIYLAFLNSDKNFPCDVKSYGDFAKSIVSNVDKARVGIAGGRLVYHGHPIDLDKSSLETIAASSSNSVFAAINAGMPSCVVKISHHLIEGCSVEVEINEHIQSNGDFGGVPKFIGYVEYVNAEGRRFHIASIFDYIEDADSAWNDAISWLSNFLKSCVEEGFSHNYVNSAMSKYESKMRKLGILLASLHKRLALDSSNSFGMYPISSDDVEMWRVGWIQQMDRALASLRSSGVKDEKLQAILRYEDEMRDFFASVGDSFIKLNNKIRQHGDFHLGQVMVKNNDFFIIDFEGEPLKSYAERSAYYPSLKDVAGLLRSLNYAAHSVCNAAGDACKGRIKGMCARWERVARDGFLDGYYDEISDSGIIPLDDINSVNLALRTLMMDKAFYEVEYEINNRPEWVSIPIDGIMQALFGGI